MIKFTRRGEAGLTLLETLVALAVLGVTAVIFLGGVSTSSRATFIADQQSTAENLLLSQMEYAKSVSYSYNASSNASIYSIAPIPETGDYTDFSANIIAEPLHDPDDGIQKITVTVFHLGEEMGTIETFKVDR